MELQAVEGSGCCSLVVVSGIAGSGGQKLYEQWVLPPGGRPWNCRQWTVERIEVGVGVGVVPPGGHGWNCRRWRAVGAAPWWPPMELQAVEGRSCMSSGCCPLVAMAGIAGGGGQCVLPPAGRPWNCRRWRVECVVCVWGGGCCSLVAAHGIAGGGGQWVLPPGGCLWNCRRWRAEGVGVLGAAPCWPPMELQAVEGRTCRSGGYCPLVVALGIAGGGGQKLYKRWVLPSAGHPWNCRRWMVEGIEVGGAAPWWPWLELQAVEGSACCPLVVAYGIAGGGGKDVEEWGVLPPGGRPWNCRRWRAEVV
eukprot:XP_025001411.1 uncharacterized protein LOC112530944 [Gallus gallus]